MDNFKKLVSYMRLAQKAYFRDRTKENLVKAKSLEKQVDDFLNGQSEILF